jgi:hypothetical protein
MKLDMSILHTGLGASKEACGLEAVGLEAAMDSFPLPPVKDVRLQGAAARLGCLPRSWRRRRRSRCGLVTVAS